jgi:hypothetical protein
MASCFFRGEHAYSGARLDVVAAVLLGAFPAFALIGVLPSWLVVPAVTWAFTRPNEPVPIPALSGNVVWNLATNVSVATGLGLGVWLRL